MARITTSNWHYLRTHFGTKSSDTLLICLLVVDMLFILAHVITESMGYSETRSFNLGYDGGFPELFQYLKFLIIVVSLAFLTFGHKKHSYIPWFILFFMLGIDDALGIHERFGWQFANRLGLDPAFGLRAIDLGELTYFLIVGMLFLSVLAVFYLRGSTHFKRTCWDILLLFGPLVFFGVGIDMLHSYFESQPIAESILLVLEDGGEMIALSLLTWYFYFITLRLDKENTFLYALFTRKKRNT